MEQDNAKTTQCFITSMREEIYRGEIEELTATGVRGELGILPGHAPLLTELMPGPVQLRKKGGEEDIFYIKGGFLEVQPDSVHILADEALREQGLSEEAAEEARKVAAEELNSKDKMEAKEYALTRAKLIEAVGQLRTLRRIKDRYKR